MWLYAKPDQCLWLTFIRFRSSQLIIVAFNAAIMKLGQCAYKFSLGLSLYGVYFCSKLLVRSDVCFCNIAQVSWVCEFFCVGLKFNYRRFWLLDFSLEHGKLVDGGLAGSLAGVWQIRSGLWKWQMPQQWHWFSARQYISFGLQQI